MSNENQSPWIITPEQLREELAKPGADGPVFLLDVREQEEYEEHKITGGPGGFKLIPLGELSERADAELKKSDNIVVYCAAGVRSLHGLMALKQLGFEKVRSLDGGIYAWEELNGAPPASH